MIITYCKTSLHAKDRWTNRTKTQPAQNWSNKSIFQYNTNYFVVQRFKANIINPIQSTLSLDRILNLYD